MAKPFTSPIRIGVDVCYIPRIQRMIGNYAKKDTDQNLLRWLARCFRREELNELRDWMVTRDSSQAGRRAHELAARLAGRWAVKEAAIKAHHHRQLFPYDVWIRATVPRLEGASIKPEILIAPPRQIVTLTSEIADKRGLNRKIPFLKGVVPQHHSSCWYRQRIQTEDQFQLADGSISHDEAYAFATVQAIDEAHPLTTEAPDDGHGDPIHLPIEGDQGYEADISLAGLKAWLTGAKSEPLSQE